MQFKFGDNFYVPVAFPLGNSSRDPYVMRLDKLEDCILLQKEKSRLIGN
jgi:hypothetical protein